MAEITPITTKSAALALADEAAAVVRQLSPRVEDLGRQIAAIEIAAERFDHTRLGADGSVTADHAEMVLTERNDALRLLIASTPATSLADAAVQTFEIFLIAERLRLNQISEAEREKCFARIQRMAASALPVISREAGLDMSAMGWHSIEPEGWVRVSLFRAVGVTD